MDHHDKAADGFGDELKQPIQQIAQLWLMSKICDIVFRPTSLTILIGLVHLRLLAESAMSEASKVINSSKGSGVDVG